MTARTGHCGSGHEGAANPYPLDPRTIELHRPRAAGMFDYLLGGHHNWGIDRTAADRAVQVCPALPQLLRQNRRFRAHAIDYCVDRGVRRFLDLGCGEPLRPMTHELIDGQTPIGRCAYVDADLLVVAHIGYALQQHGDPDRHIVLHADLRAPAHVLAAAHNAGTTSPREPICLLVTNVAHFIDDAPQVLSEYIRLLPPGSYVVLSHLVSHYMGPRVMTALQSIFGDTTTGPLRFRTRRSLNRMLKGLDLVGSGFRPPSLWCNRCHHRNPAVVSTLQWLTAIARKPHIAGIADEEHNALAEAETMVLAPEFAPSLAVPGRGGTPGWSSR